MGEGSLLSYQDSVLLHVVDFIFTKRVFIDMKTQSTYRKNLPKALSVHVMAAYSSDRGVNG